MANKISEKFFTQGDFSKETKEALKKVIDKTDFQLGKEIWRGVIYDKSKVGSIIFEGKLKNKPAVLKLQGLKTELDEIKIHKLFFKFSKSKKIRLPELYAGKSWNTKDGFGYSIQEQITGNNIFKMPFATPTQRKQFANFYNEYKNKVVVKPWFSNKIKTKEFATARLKNWIEICKHEDCWDENEMAPRVELFKKLIDEKISKIPMVFSHGHLSANDLFVEKGKFILMSNLFWSFRPKYYDLAFNVWACLVSFSSSDSFKKANQLIEDWIKTYKTIPWVKKQKDFDESFKLILIERLIGTMIVDLGLIRNKSNCRMKRWRLNVKVLDNLIENL